MSLPGPSHKDGPVLEFLSALDRSAIPWLVRDHWQADRCAVGVASVAHPDRLAYVSSWDQPRNHFYVELEGESSGDEDYVVVARLESVEMAVAIAEIARHFSALSQP